MSVGWCSVPGTSCERPAILRVEPAAGEWAGTESPPSPVICCDRHLYVAVGDIVLRRPGARAVVELMGRP